MPAIKNRYVLAGSAGALLLGVVFLWFGQSSSPETDSSNVIASESTSTEGAIGVVSGSTSALLTSSSTNSTSAGPASDQTASADAGNQDAPQFASPASVALSKNASTATESPQPEPATPNLSPRVYEVINEVQERQLAGDWEAALNEMNALYSELDQLTPFEQATLLNFYTNTLTRLEMWQEAITAFNLILQVPDLRPDLSARALLALGQLHVREGERVEGIAYLKEWLNYTDGMENMDALTPRVNDMITCLSSTAGMNCTL